jgi:hypothetical protein
MIKVAKIVIYLIMLGVMVLRSECNIMWPEMHKLLLKNVKDDDKRNKAVI